MTTEFKLVPVEPTLDMGWAYLDAARDAQPDKNFSFSIPGYRAMLAAAPTPPQPIYDEAKERELFNSWYGELPTTKLKETMWMAWEACAQSRAKSVEVGHE